MFMNAFDARVVLSTANPPTENPSPRQCVRQLEQGRLVGRKDIHLSELQHFGYVTPEP